MKPTKIFYWMLFPYLMIFVSIKDLFSKDRMGFSFCLSVVLSYIRYRTEPMVNPQEHRLRRVLGDEKYNTYFQDSPTENLSDETNRNTKETTDQ